MTALLLGKGLNTNQGRVKAAAQAQHIAAFHGKEAGEGAEVDPVHAEGPGEAAHLGKHGAHLVHLRCHAGINENAQPQHKADGKGPDGKREPALAQLVTENGHTSPSLL